MCSLTVYSSWMDELDIIYILILFMFFVFIGVTMYLYCIHSRVSLEKEILERKN